MTNPDLFPDPEGRGNHFVDKNGTLYVFRAGQTAEQFFDELNRPPPPERRLVMKSLIISRLIDAKKISAAKAALDSDASAYARWWAPDRPSIYFDDPDAIALLKAIGADPDAILAE